MAAAPAASAAAMIFAPSRSLSRAGAGPMQMAEGVPLVRKGALDIARARAELGYAPRYDVRAGLAACVAAARERAAG